MADADFGLQANDSVLIAPCGVNCRLCRSYLRDRHPCPGCRGGDCHKSKASITCAIKNCKELAIGKYRFCFSCAEFPCTVLLHLDHRYRARYSVSVIENLERIKAVGVEKFITEETTKWSCPECASFLCMHKPLCVNCGYEWQHQ
jgi:hypothetical protein